jgi:hypothetical protein
MCEGGDVYRVFGQEIWGKKTNGGPRFRREDNIYMDLQELGSGDMDLFGLVQGRYKWRALANAVMNLRAT